MNVAGLMARLACALIPAISIEEAWVLSKEDAEKSFEKVNYSAKEQEK